MKQIITFLVTISAAAFIIMGLRSSHQKEIKDLKQQLAHAQTFVPVQHDTVRYHDTVIEVATSPVILAQLSDLKKQHLVDEELIKALGIKVKQLEATQTTTTQISDTVPASYDSDTKAFHYNDQWADITFQPTDTTFYYNIRDSLSTIVYREYKHKLLWWRWGTKGYRLKIVNYNPHAHVLYNRYIKPQ